MNRTLILLFITLCIGCKNKTNCSLNEKVLKANDSILLKTKSDKILAKFLTKTDELELESYDDEIYRFMVLGAWGNSQIYRIRKNRNDFTISSKKYWKHDKDKEIDSLGKVITKKMSENDWNEIKKSLDVLSFWSLPVRIDDDHYLDGTGYIIEGYNPRKNECTKRNYHATARTSPRDTTIYKSIFKKITRIASE